MNKIKIFEAFAGIGANSKALTNLGIDHEIVGYSEIDKHASKSFAAIHGVSEELNFGDITKIDKLPCEIDLLTGGFPCQPFSNAGKGLGIIDQRGLLAMDMVRIAKFNKPKVIIAENVKGILSAKHKPLLDLYISELEKIGYTTEYRLLNSKDFGVPQNRERVFIISTLNLTFDFKKLQKKEMKPLNKFVDFKNDGKIKLNIKQATKSGFKEIETPGIANLSFPTSKSRRGRVIQNGKIRGTLLTSPEWFVIEEKNGEFVNTGSKTSKLGFFGKDYYDKRVYELIEPIPTICTTNNPYFANEFTIRKLTTLESFRLMGFDDEDHDKCLAIGMKANQLYKQAGNSIVVPVLQEIIKELYGGSNETNNNQN